MSAAWIKLDHDLPSKPEFLQIKRLCKLKDVQECVGRLYSVWCFADKNSIDGVLTNVSLEDIDDVAGYRGFGQAMVASGWLQEKDAQLQVPNWNRHHSSSAKERAMDSERKRRSRQENA